MVEDPPLGAFDAPTQNIRKISDCAVPLKRAGIEASGRTQFARDARMSTKLRPLDELLAEIDNLMGHVAGVSDERDSVPILLAMRERWPQIRAHIERLRAGIAD
jgi:hypothetical protein